MHGGLSRRCRARTACARSTNSVTASPSSIGGRSNSDSPAIRSGSRLVATIRRAGAAASSSASGRAASGRSCSRLSRTTCACLLTKPRCDRGGGVAGGAESLGDQGHDQRCVADGGERHEHRAAVRLLGQEPGQLDREPRLARAAGTDDRQQRAGRGRARRAAAAKSSRSRPRNCVAGTGRSIAPGVRRGGNSATPSWNKRAGASKSFSRCCPRSRSGSPSSERGRRGRDEHLPAVRERRDPSSAMHVDPDIALDSHRRCSGVQAHPNRDRPCRERLLPDRAAAAAPAAVGKATKKASPCVSTSTPPSATNASRSTRRWPARASAYSSGPTRRNSRVDPSMSVNRNVTVPAGRSPGTDRVSPTTRSPAFSELVAVGFALRRKVGRTTERTIGQAVVPLRSSVHAARFAEQTARESRRPWRLIAWTLRPSTSTRSSTSFCSC